MTALQKRPFQSLYVHVPFCNGKCGYCAFYSLPEHDAGLRAQYLERMAYDMERGAVECAPLRSVFIGGGTPSALSVRELEDLLGGIRARFSQEDSCEWTVECNPDSLTEEKIGVLAATGVTRLSLGVQSFSGQLRSVLGRRGEVVGLGRLLDRARAEGIIHIGMDLIYAVPGQTLTQWMDDLARAAEHDIDHLSAYALTVEEGTKLAREELPPVDDTLFCELWDATDQVLSQAGLHRYEISNFSRPGCECRHNLDVWRGCTYLGLGPAAVSFDGRDRFANSADLDLWLAGSTPEIDELPMKERLAEMFAFGFRTLSGWNIDQFSERFGIEVEEVFGAELACLTEAGLVERRGRIVSPSRRGLLLNDTIVTQLLFGADYCPCT